MELLETVTVGASGAASIDFTSIPTDGTDLLIKFSGRSSFADSVIECDMRLNGVTSASYNTQMLRLTGTLNMDALTGYNRMIIGYIPGATSTGGQFSNCDIYIPNYAVTTKKTDLYSELANENNATTAGLSFAEHWFDSNLAITSVSIYPAYGTLIENSSASLYKITKA